MVFKAILTIEGMGRTLDPDFDLLAMGEDLVKDLVKNQYSMQRLSKETLFIAKDIVALLQVLPRQIRWMLRKFNSNDFAFEIKSSDFQELQDSDGPQWAKDQPEHSGGRLIYRRAASLCNVDVGDSSPDIPSFSVVFFAIGLFFLLSLLFRSFK